MTKKYIFATVNQVPTRLNLSEFKGIGRRINRNLDVNEFDRQEYVRLVTALLEGHTIIFAPEEELPF